MRRLVLSACPLPATALAETMTVTADIRGDNWFEMYVNGEWTLGGGSGYQDRVVEWVVRGTSA